MLSGQFVWWVACPLNTQIKRPEREEGREGTGRLLEPGKQLCCRLFPAREVDVMDIGKAPELLYKVFNYISTDKPESGSF